jgi:hypothetical protein
VNETLVRSKFPRLDHKEKLGFDECIIHSSNSHDSPIVNDVSMDPADSDDVSVEQSVHRGLFL